MRALDGLIENLRITFRQCKLIKRNRLAAGKQTNDNIFQTAHCWDCRNTQLDIQRPELLEIDLAVLRLASFGYIHISHDLDPGRDSKLVLERKFLIDGALTVNAGANDDILFARIGFHMNV